MGNFCNMYINKHLTVDTNNKKIISSKKNTELLESDPLKLLKFCHIDTAK